MQLGHAHPQYDVGSVEAATPVHQIMKLVASLEESKIEIRGLKRNLVEEMVRARVAEAEVARLSEVAKGLEGKLQASVDQHHETLGNEAVVGSARREADATCNRACCIDQDRPNGAAECGGHENDSIQEVQTVNQSHSIDEGDVSVTQGPEYPALEQELKRKPKDTSQFYVIWPIMMPQPQHCETMRGYHQTNTDPAQRGSQLGHVGKDGALSMQGSAKHWQHITGGTERISGTALRTSENSEGQWPTSGTPISDHPPYTLEPIMDYLRALLCHPGLPNDGYGRIRRMDREGPTMCYIAADSFNPSPEAVQREAGWNVYTKNDNLLELLAGYNGTVRWLGLENVGGQELGVLWKAQQNRPFAIAE
ncbi:hypothetical protein FA13DRAFT_1712914 [Coprinellus micaceus]|uniref:Uncharacterized protein n=1 Tax=Coprinellus micaceus TaxID=71717 RepID=A0A4Y7SYJ1_COPMI|nr:hypothetical protein FA13DRAFT_1712914 [Coprinellus micaceus]